MIGVNILFIVVAGVAFLGFIINALFDKIRITKVMPLMIIGLLIGPILHLVPTGATSTVAALTPFITAIAVAFILFDVGLNTNIYRLNKVIKKATEFTFLLAVATGLAIAGMAFAFLHWNIIECLIFGFALSGPSSIIVPTLMKFVNASPEMKTALVYESVITDILQLVIPLLLFNILANTGFTMSGAAIFLLEVVVGSVIFGSVAAMSWLYILNRFREYSKTYTWMLTITMVIATYGIAQSFSLSGALTVFVFGLLFSNLGGIIIMTENSTKDSPKDNFKRAFNELMKRYFYFENTKYVKDYQHEIEFFTSTFFFVYIGMLVDIRGSNIPMLALIGAAVIVVVMTLRRLFSPMLDEYMSGTDEKRVKGIVYSNVARGMSPAIIATLPLALGIIIPNFLNEMFAVILFSNIASTIGIAYSYRGSADTSKKAEAEDKVKKTSSLNTNTSLSS